MLNQRVARVLNRLADQMEVREEVFKERAYRRAALSIEALPRPIEDVYHEGELESIPGVGESIAGKISEVIETGHLEYLERLEREAPRLRELLAVPGVGPKTAERLSEELGVETVEDLRRAAEQHRIRRLRGFGAKTEQNILSGVEYGEATLRRRLLGYALPLARRLENYMRGVEGVRRVSLAGSLRRRRETIGDIDLLVSTEDSRHAIEAFTSLEDMARILEKGPEKATVILEGDVQADLRVVRPNQYGAALQYFTGSKEHNVRLRNLAIRMGLKINEYGVFNKSTGERVAGETEEEVYGALDLRWIPPELRENRGDIQAAREDRLPHLVEPGDMRGDFHVHTNWSDGAVDIGGMVEAAQNRGYEFICVSDHVGLPVAHGLDRDRLLRQIEVIHGLQDEYEGIRVLAGAEVDITRDGGLAMDDDVLERLDVVIGSVHSSFKLGVDRMTRRILRAMDNPHVNIIGHPTGRLIGRREPYKVDVERVIRYAAKTGAFLELNAYPDRLDLKDEHLRMAKEAGVRVAVSTDAHSPEHLGYMELGVSMVRRGWLEPGDVLNTLGIKKLERLGLLSKA